MRQIRIGSRVQESSLALQTAYCGWILWRPEKLAPDADARWKRLQLKPKNRRCSSQSRRHIRGAQTGAGRSTSAAVAFGDPRHDVRCEPAQFQEARLSAPCCNWTRADPAATGEQHLLSEARVSEKLQQHRIRDFACRPSPATTSFSSLPLFQAIGPALAHCLLNALMLTISSEAVS